MQEFVEIERDDFVIFFLIFTTIGNILIAVVKFIFCITTLSLWFGVNMGFEIVLCLARIFSIRDYGKMRAIKDKQIKRKIGYKNYLNNGILLIILGIVYFFVSVYVYYEGTTTNMHEYLTYLVAFTAFWSIGSAIYGMIKYKKNHSPLLKAVKITNWIGYN